MKNWQDVKTKSAPDDINKFVQIHGKSESETKRLLVDAYLNVSKQFPMVWQFSEMCAIGTSLFRYGMSL